MDFKDREGNVSISKLNLWLGLLMTCAAIFGVWIAGVNYGQKDTPNTNPVIVANECEKDEDISFALKAFCGNGNSGPVIKMFNLGEKDSVLSHRIRDSLVEESCKPKRLVKPKKSSIEYTGQVVRYFHKEDESLATAIASHINQNKISNPTFGIHYLKEYANKVDYGRVEVWFR